MSKATVDIVITTYKGRELLKKNLPRVIKLSPTVKKIIVIIDDGGKDDTKKFLQEKYPQIKVLSNKKNIGFVKSTNKAVASSKADFVILFNNDVYPTNDYLKSSLEYFKNKDVFAVTFNEQHSAPPQVSWQKGKFHFTRTKDKSQPRYSAWPSGGTSIIRKSIWEKLGGFNEIYSPGYWEDIDIGWRAWKSGYRIVFDPQAKVVHHHQSTFDLLDKKYVQTLKERNELLFTWLNISDTSLSFSHMMSMILYSSLHPGYFKVIFKALFRLPQANKHLYNSKNQKRTDKEVLALVNQTL